jgi:DDE family transposase
MSSPKKASEDTLNGLKMNYSVLFGGLFMLKQYPIPVSDEQALPYEAADIAQGVGIELATFLFPLLVTLDSLLDKRLVRTFLSSIQLIITFRDRVHGLLLSEMGGYLLSPEQERAGTKRLANVLHSPNWSAEVIEQFLWQRATRFLTTLEQRAQPVYAIWDESVWEKPESQQMADLGPVRSSKAHRLTHYKPGYAKPPSRPICVPGMNWLGLILVGPKARLGPPVVAAMRWWSRRGLHADTQRRLEARLLLDCVATWGRWPIHVFDRGFAGSPWLRLCVAVRQRFIVRWPHGQYLLDEQGRARKAWQIARGKRAWGRRRIWNAHLNRHLDTAVLAFPVRHPDFAVPLWLVVSRQGKGRRPWYLLTTEEVRTEAQAWQIVFAYARRWQIEGTWRFTKSELGFECPRLREWEHCRKLLLMATLAYAFLLSLMREERRGWRRWMMHHSCHRTGKKARQASLPLYRLRLSLSRLWQAYPPRFELLAMRRLE